MRFGQGGSDAHRDRLGEDGVEDGVGVVVRTADDRPLAVHADQLGNLGVHEFEDLSVRQLRDWSHRNYGGVPPTTKHRATPSRFT